MIVPLNPYSVTCLQIRPVKTPGNLRAFADVQIGPLVVTGCRIVQQPGQAAWVSMPQVQADNGTFYPCLRTDDDALRADVRERVLRAAASAGVLRTDSEQQAVAA
jgi:DNA-binding cell septation regulator SpoVG